jgi:hypothetical protein
MTFWSRARGRANGENDGDDATMNMTIPGPSRLHGRNWLGEESG